MVCDLSLDISGIFLKETALLFRLAVCKIIIVSVDIKMCVQQNNAS